MKQQTIWTKKYFIAFMAVIACILWGSAFPVLKITYSELQIAATDVSARMLLAGARFFLAGVMVFAVQKLILRQPLKVPRTSLVPLLVLGLVQTGLQYYFFYNGVAAVSGIKSAVLNSVGNFFVVIFAPFVYRDDRLNPGKVLGLLAGFAGIVLANWQPNTAIGWEFTLRGEGFLVLAGLTMSIATFGAKGLGQKLSPIIVNAYQLIFGSVLLLALGIPSLINGGLTPTPLFWLLFVYSAVLSAAAFSIWYTLLKHTKAGEVTIYRFVIPIAGAILSAVFLPDESLTLSILAALLLVAAGIGAVNYWQRMNGKKQE
ncbi:MAG TPA: DMT family transporter [Limnochordia bacterium]|nr:DMT family transporter [Limnochordia bacterium]